MTKKSVSELIEDFGDTILLYTHTRPRGFTDKALGAACMVLISVIMDKMWDLQEKENMEFKDRAAMATACGAELRGLVKKFTGIDMHELYAETRKKGV
jgi:hypothetical protein